MSVTRITQKPSKFKFDETVVGLRLPTVDEMKQITQKRSDYLKTVRAGMISDKQDDIETAFSQEGDAAMLVGIELFVSGLLCCDPDNAIIPWFAKDETDQRALAATGVQKDTPNDVPASFHHIAFQVFTVASASAKPVDFSKEADETIDAEAQNTPPLEIEKTEMTTTTSSAVSASKSASISE